MLSIDPKAACILSVLSSSGLPCPLEGNSVTFKWFKQELTGIFRGISETNGQVRMSIQTGIGSYYNVNPKDIISIGKISEYKLWKH